MEAIGRDEAGQGTLTTHLVGRLSAALWIATGMLVAVAGAVLQFRPGSPRGPAWWAPGWRASPSAPSCYRMPWARWRRSATLWLVPLALA